MKRKFLSLLLIGALSLLLAGCSFKDTMLYLYGGDSLKGMAESQMIGIVIGTLSSIFISGALLTMGPLRVTKQDLMPKAKDEAALARRP